MDKCLIKFTYLVTKRIWSYFIRKHQWTTTVYNSAIVVHWKLQADSCKGCQTLSFSIRELCEWMMWPATFFANCDREWGNIPRILSQQGVMGGEGAGGFIKCHMWTYPLRECEKTEIKLLYTFGWFTEGVETPKHCVNIHFNYPVTWQEFVHVQVIKVK